MSWKNYDSIHGRMLKCRAAFDALNESLGIVITDAFEKLKLEELRLVYEEAFRHQEEKDRIREEKEREREEVKAQRELQAEIARSEKREREREAALAEARSELAAASEAERSAFAARVADLEAQLAKAHEQTERTKSMAEQTRIGHSFTHETNREGVACASFSRSWLHLLLFQSRDTATEPFVGRHLVRRD